jgi:hypothetical protein
LTTQISNINKNEKITLPITINDIYFNSSCTRNSAKIEFKGEILDYRKSKMAVNGLRKFILLIQEILL